MTGFWCLVVDDEKSIRDLMGEILKEEIHGCIVHYASNGKEALQLTKKYRYDVICTDVDMPMMDGLKFLEKAFETTLDDRTKVLIISGSNIPEDHTVYKNKNVRIIEKPCTNKDLIKGIGNLMK